MAPSNSVTAFRDALRQSRSIVAVAGAGLSAASDISTFREKGGYWKNYDPRSLATPEAFAENPSLVWQFYHYRRSRVMGASPNAAHYALVTLSLPELLGTIAPQANFTFITQNVDSLSTRALNEVLQKRNSGATIPPPAPLYEMHGRLADTICTSCKRKETNLAEKSLCPALETTGAPPAYGESEDAVADIPLAELPQCGHCGGLLRPGVVWFGETPRHLDEIDEAVGSADMCLVVGTSSTVYPAAGYAYEVSSQGGKVAIFNMERTDGDDESDFLFLGPCEQTLPNVLFGGPEPGSKASV